MEPTMRSFIPMTALPALWAALLLATAAQAQTTMPPRACAEDLRQYCNGVRPGDGRMVACLQRNEAQLCAACKAELATLAQCADEVKRMCGDAGPYQTRECLRSKAEQFSAACRAATAAPG
jgi:Cysteine rich repeat